MYNNFVDFCINGLNVTPNYLQAVNGIKITGEYCKNCSDFSGTNYDLAAFYKKVKFLDSICPICGYCKQNTQMVDMCIKEGGEATTLAHMLMLYYVYCMDKYHSITAIHCTDKCARTGFNSLQTLIKNSQCFEKHVSDENTLTVVVGSGKISFVDTKLSAIRRNNNAMVYIENFYSFPVNPSEKLISQRDAVLDAAKNTLLAHQAAFEKGVVGSCGLLLILGNY